MTSPTFRPPVRSVWPASVVALVTIAFVAWLPRPLNSDVAGQLWLAHALRQGARLYVDIAEINPPLWFWMAIPVDWLAERLHLPADGVLIAACGALVLASVAATGRLFGDRPHRTAFLLYAAAVLLVAPARDIGQREFIVLAAALPYTVLAAARRERRRVSSPLAMLVGIGAGLGFALKHYFLGVPLLLEVWLLVGLRRDWRPIRIETLALAAVGLAYAAAVVWRTPAYLSDTIPMLGLAYGGVGLPWREMTLPAQSVWLLLVVLIGSQHRHLRDAPLTVALVLAGVAFAAAWAIQHKGWPYQAIPATGALALALAALLVEAGPRVAVVVRRVAVAALVLPVALVAMPTHAPLTGDYDIAPMLTGLRPGDVLGLISTEGFTVWPAAIRGRFRPASRYGQYWMLATLDARDPAVAAVGRRVVRDTAHDWRCLPPRRIVVARPDGPTGKAVGNPLPFFRRDAAFAAVFARYRLVKRHGIFDAYDPAAPIAPLVSDRCRRAV